MQIKDKKKKKADVNTECRYNILMPACNFMQALNASFNSSCVLRSRHVRKNKEKNKATIKAKNKAS